jgi:hypothetical protein
MRRGELDGLRLMLAFALFGLLVGVRVVGREATTTANAPSIAAAPDTQFAASLPLGLQPAGLPSLTSGALLPVLLGLGAMLFAIGRVLPGRSTLRPPRLTPGRWGRGGLYAFLS